MVIEFLKDHPNVDKVYVKENGDFFLKPVAGAELVTRESALKPKKQKAKTDDPLFPTKEDDVII